MHSEIYFIRTPLREKAGLVYGGPLRIRTGRSQAYAGFASRQLAERVCAHWSMTRNVCIEPWYDAVEHDAPDARPAQILFFDGWSTFESFIRKPGTFPFTRHLVDLHPAMIQRKFLEAQGK